MKNIISLQDLMTAQLQNVYAAESQWNTSLHDNLPLAHAEIVREMLEHSIKHTSKHINELGEILQKLEAGLPELSHGSAAQMAKDNKELLNRTADPEVRDAALILTHQCMNHYLIAKYGTLSSYARLLQMEPVATRLHRILEEEKTEDELLTKIAEGKINPKAKSPVIL